MSIITTRVTQFEVDGVDYSDSTSAAAITSDDGIKVWTNGGQNELRTYTLEITAGQDLAVDSLWFLAFTRGGQLVPVILKPYGNAEPTEDQPWLYTMAQVTEPAGDLVGGAMGTSTTTKRTFSASWSCLRPELITSTTAGV